MASVTLREQVLNSLASGCNSARNVNISVREEVGLVCSHTFVRQNHTDAVAAKPQL